MDGGLIPTEVSDRLQAVLDEASASSGVAGIQAAVVIKDGSLWSGGSGVGDVASGKAMSPDLLMGAVVSSSGLVTPLGLRPDCSTLRLVKCEGGD